MDKHYHLIGIGGIGMSGIAKLLLGRGIKVSGSDLQESKATEELRGLGAEVFLGHSPQHLSGATTVVYSSAIKEDNPELLGARGQRIPLLKRAQALSELMLDKAVIAVTGSHGKTTTTSLASCLLIEAGLLPTVAIGGTLRNIDTNASLGDGEFFVAEADESDGSFLYYEPKYSIITNIDYEHLDYYGEFRNAVNAFKEFLSRTKPDGCAFCCHDDAHLKNILKNYKGRHKLFGLSSGADIYPQNIRINGLSSSFDCFYRDKLVDSFTLALGGMHNISNALAVIALGLELGIGLEIIKKTLADYKGVRRRLEVKFDACDYLIIDDYAHHPTEITATLAAIRNLRPRRLIAVFQPHRYSRTKLLLGEFAKSFILADYVIVTDIYSANEPALEGISAKTIYDKIRAYLPDKKADFLPKEAVTEHILGIIRPKDLVVILGAGDIVKISDELAQRLSGYI